MHWQTGQTIKARDWIQELYTLVFPLAKQAGYGCFLSPVQSILRNGNQAQQWLKLIEEGYCVQSILIQSIALMAQEELELQNQICEPVAL